MFRKTGIQRIDALVGQLLTIKANLNLGIDEIDDVLASNRAVQESIKADNRILGAKRTRATNLAKNIEELLG